MMQQPMSFFILMIFSLNNSVQVFSSIDDPEARLDAAAAAEVDIDEVPTKRNEATEAKKWFPLVQEIHLAAARQDGR